MNRPVLARSTIAFAVLGVAFVTVALVGSLRPNAKAAASLPRIDVSGLKPGQAELRDHPLNGDLFGGFRWSVLLLRHADGKVSAWDVPTIDGKVGMPDVHWWLPFYACDRFGVAIAAVDGKRYFTCADPKVPSEYWRKEWQWSETGKALGQSVDDMQATVGGLEGRYFVVGLRE
jgi:hypothetical protein